MAKILDLPALDYFTSKNVFVGSHGKDFRFRIAPSEGTLKAEIWHTDVCYELCEVSESNTFELTQDGLATCIDWVEGLISQ